jgi:site-specific DNA recombinase
LAPKDGDDVTDNRTRAAGYCRVSTDDQAEHGYSMDEQARLIAEHAGREGRELVETYTDAGWSGAREDRPALKRMLAGGEAGGFDVLCVWAMDRLGRDLLLLGKVTRTLNEFGVQLHSRTSN